MSNSDFFCKLCGSISGHLVIDHVRDSIDYSVFSCNFCGHVQLFPQPDHFENIKFYDNNTQATWVRPSINIDVMRKQLTEDTMRRSEYIEGLMYKDFNVLDVGCGFGFFIEEMARRGWEIEGLEISKNRREIAEKILGKRLYNFNLSTEMNIPEKLYGFFNIIVAFQVFEHVLNPAKFLSGIKKLLAPDGVLILEMPNRDDHMIQLCKGYCNFYYQKAHVSYFNGDDLKLLFEKTGYKDIEIGYIQRYSVENAMYWMDNGKPQINNPSFKCNSNLRWLDNYYRNYLIKQKMSDTVLATGIVNGL